MNGAQARVSNHVYYVVREAIWAGVSPEEFKRMVAACWQHALVDEAKSADKVLRS